MTICTMAGVAMGCGRSYVTHLLQPAVLLLMAFAIARSRVEENQKLGNGENQLLQAEWARVA